MEHYVKTGNPAVLGASRIGKYVNFAVTLRSEEACSLLLYRIGEKEPEEEIPFTEEMWFGDILAMQVEGISFAEYEYNYRIGDQVVQDPYAKAVCGREIWGRAPQGEHAVRCGMQVSRISWNGDERLRLPYEECILYVTHPRGFTMDSSAGVRHPGTFAGIREKIPYLKKLGVTQLELMPVYEFGEADLVRACRKHEPIHRGSTERMNYWGYGAACFFAPKMSYSASGNPAQELKELVRELHKNGIELILEFYFPELTSQHLIVECLKYWVKEYHIDGFHVNSRGVPLAMLAWTPELSDAKLMSEEFPLEQIYERDYRPHARHLAAYHDDFLVKARRFLRGDEDMLWQITEALRKNPEQEAIVNYIAGHNGFTLADAVSYEEKHNEANGEENRDGSSYNYSSNYGEEGPTGKRAVAQLRHRQIRNALLLVLLSQGVPAIYGGDEMGNSQNGNNNGYCQDNPVSWVQWSKKQADRRLQRFVRDAIAFRKGHAAFGRRKAYVMKDFLSKGMPDLSYHGRKAWYGEFEAWNRQVGILYAGCYTGDSTLYVIYNMHSVEQELALPTLPKGMQWYLAGDTSLEEQAFLKNEQPLENQRIALVPARTIWILEGE